jgi:hypothetical protein
VNLIQLQKQLSTLAEEILNLMKTDQGQGTFFADTCFEKLKSFDPCYVPTIEELHDDLTKIKLPIQTFHGLDFSDFPLTLVRNDLFSIDLYYWSSTDTGTHNHHFEGAFKIIKGSSYQVEYEFKATHDFGRCLTQGELIEKSSTFMGLNEIQKILKYDKFIHQVFHTELPTITLCIRSNSVFSAEPLSAYLFPKYKVSLYDLDVNKYKWLRLLQSRLISGDRILSIPLEEHEIVLSIYKSITGRDKLGEESFNLLINYLREKNFAVDFIDILEKSEKRALKMKKFAIAVMLEKEREKYSL